MLYDFFDTKWKHQNPEIRLKAIKKLKDNKKLISIIKNDTDAECRIVALTILKDPNILIELIEDISKNSSKEIQLLVEKMGDIIEQTSDYRLLSKISERGKYAPIVYKSDDKIKLIIGNILCKEELLEIIEQDFCMSAKHAAIYKISDLKILVDISSKKKLYQPAKDRLRILISQIKDEEKLINILKEIENYELRLIAISNIETQSIIEKYAITDKQIAVRKKAIQKLEKQSTLVELIKNDTCSGIRSEALKRVYDQSILVNYILDNEPEEVRVAAITNLTDQEYLVHIAANEKNENIRAAAVNNINIVKLLENLALNDESYIVRRNAIKKVSNQEILRKYTFKDCVFDVIDKITDQHIIYHAAKNEYWPDKRLQAVKRLTDEVLLTDIAKCDKTQHESRPYSFTIGKGSFQTNIIAHTAISKIFNPTLLKDIVLNSKKTMAKIEAAYRIKDQQIMIDLFLSCDDSIRRILASNFENETAYQNIVVQSKTLKVKKDAIKMISDQELLLQLFLTEKEKPIKKLVLEKISDQKCLSEIIITDKDISLKESLMEKISNQQILKSLITNKNIDLKLRIEAIHKLENQSIISEFAQTITDIILRTIAVKKLTNKDILAIISNNDQNSTIRNIAKERLDIYS